MKDCIKEKIGQTSNTKNYILKSLVQSSKGNNANFSVH